MLSIDSWRKQYFMALGACPALKTLVIGTYQDSLIGPPAQLLRRKKMAHQGNNVINFE